MGLTSIQAKDPEMLDDYRVDQIVALAGDGRLKDESLASNELRNFLKTVGHQTSRLCSPAEFEALYNRGQQESPAVA